MASFTVLRVQQKVTVIFSLSPLRVRKSKNYSYRNSQESNNIEKEPSKQKRRTDTHQSYLIFLDICSALEHAASTGNQTPVYYTQPPIQQGKCRLCKIQTLFFHNIQRHLFLQSINNTNRRKSEFLNKKVVACDLK